MARPTTPPVTRPPGTGEDPDQGPTPLAHAARTAAASSRRAGDRSPNALVEEDGSVFAVSSTLPVPRRLLALATLALLLASLLPIAHAAAPSALASHTPDPSSVTIAGDLQSELGCGGDWDPGCATTHLTFDAGDDVWQGIWTVPAGSWQYKAALNNGW